MKNVVDFLDWLVELDIRHYKTESLPDYTPSGKSHFYLAGSPERFTSEEMVLIWKNKAKKELSERWLYAMSDHVQYNKRH